MAIEVVSVTKTYGPVRALAGVSASFPIGEITMILGPNGSGKSTLLSLLGTLSRPTLGRVDHGELGHRREEVRAVLGWMGHDSLCYVDLTGRENLAFAARLHGLGRDAVERVVDRFALGAFLERPFATCSRGQRQRIALARALVHAPRLLLLDEPTTGLDAGGVRRLTGVLEEERARGVTAIVVSHDTGFAAVADRRLTLDRGRVSPDVSRETSGAG